MTHHEKSLRQTQHKSEKGLEKQAGLKPPQPQEKEERKSALQQMRRSTGAYVLLVQYYLH